jgi:hypothetical protein
VAEAVPFADIVSRYKEFNSGDFENVPPGTYTLRVKAVSHKDASDKQYLNPVYVVESGPEAGKTITAGTLSYKDQANIGRTLDKLRSFGIGQEELTQIFANGGGWAEVGKALVGRVIEAELTVQGGNTQYADRNNLPFKFKLISAPDISGATAPAGAPPPPAPPAAADDTPPPPPPPPAAPPATDPGDDEPSF